MAPLHLCAEQIQHVGQQPTLITMASVKGDMLLTLITSTFGLMPVYKIECHRVNV